MEKSKENKKINVVFDILNNFDFRKSVDIMEHLDWQWCGKVPEESEVRTTCKDLLLGAYDDCEESGEETFYATGGYKASACSNEAGDIQLRLEFVPVEWDNYDW